MFSSLIVVLLICHVLADFYFQSEKLLIKKKQHWQGKLIHVLIHFIIMLLGLSIVFKINLDLVVFTVIICVFHYVTDYLKLTIAYKNDLRAFCLDQLSHVVTIIIIAYIYTNYYDLQYFALYSDLMIKILLTILKILIVLLLILKPTGIFIDNFLSMYELNNYCSEQEDIRGSGKMVGYLERLTIFALLLVGQYLVIGFIGAIKTGIRYDQITKNKLSADYYLIGTLLSVLSVLILFLLFNNVFLIYSW